MARSSQRKPGQPENRKPRTEQEPEAKRGAGQVAMDWLKSLFMGFVLFLVLRTFLIQTFTITSGSMEGTLLVGDFLVLSKSAYGATVPGTEFRLPGYTDINRGDIIVFRGHHEPIDLVKRVVGMPGDTLAMRNGILLLNGEPQEESFVRHSDPSGDGTHPWMYWQRDFLVDGLDPAVYRPTRDAWGPLVVPPGEFFVLGDNRDESLDSRYWGFVPAADIKGKAVALYFSYDHAGRGMPFLRAIRWDRIGELLR
jgi:signal peptidase I